MRLNDWIAPLNTSSSEVSSSCGVMSTRRIAVFWSMRSTASLISATAARLRSPTRMVSPSQSRVSSFAAVHDSPLDGWTSTEPVMDTNRPTAVSQAAWAQPAASSHRAPTMPERTNIARVKIIGTSPLPCFPESVPISALNRSHCWRNRDAGNLRRAPTATPNHQIRTLTIFINTSTIKRLRRPHDLAHSDSLESPGKGLTPRAGPRGSSLGAKWARQPHHCPLGSDERACNIRTGLADFDPIQRLDLD